MAGFGGHLLAQLCPIVETDIGIHPNNILLVAFVCQAYIGVTHAVGVVLNGPWVSMTLILAIVSTSTPVPHFPYLWIL